MWLMKDKPKAWSGNEIPVQTHRKKIRKEDFCKTTYRRFPNLLYRRLQSRQSTETLGSQRIWKSAIQQTWKSALQTPRSGIFFLQVLLELLVVGVHAVKIFR
jgi:hypothetical protein